MVAQLYFEKHATLIRLDSARTCAGEPVDLLAPGALDAWLGTGGVTVETAVAAGMPTQVAMSGALDATVATLQLEYSNLRLRVRCAHIRDLGESAKNS